MRLIGRTGGNAYKERLTTHLRMMVLACDDGRMNPVNPWRELLRAKVVREDSLQMAESLGWR